MGIDQHHEQLNADIKGGGGAIGLTEDDEKFLRWMLCAPEEGRMVPELEQNSVLNKIESDLYRHHEQADSFQNKFKKDVSKLENEFQKYGNPFKSRDTDLIHIISNDVFDDDAVQTVKNVEMIGEKARKSFMTLLKTNPSAFNDSIRLIRLRVYRKKQQKQNTKNVDKEMKDQVQLFSKLYIAASVRDGDIEDFF